MPYLTAPTPRLYYRQRVSGLGATGGKELTGAQIATLKPRLYRIYEMATTLFNDIDNAKKTALVSWGMDELQARLNMAQTRFATALDDLRLAIESGRYEGFVLRDIDVATLVTNIVSSATEYNTVIKEWNSNFPSTKLGELASQSGALLGEIVNTFQGLARSGVKVLSWLPWIIGILLIGPPLIRIVLAGRRKGADAALEETGGALERGRKSAGSAARNAAAVALAPETGGASLALRGVSRRKRRSAKRRG